MKKQIIFASILLLCWANAQSVTVRTVTVKASGGDYTSMANAFAGEVAISSNLITSDIQLNIEVYKNPTDENITSFIRCWNFITDTTHYINVYTAPEARHKGTWDSSKHFIKVTGFQNAILLYQNCIRFEGFQIDYSTPPYASGSLCIRFDKDTVGGNLRLRDNRLISNIVINTGALPTQEPYLYGNNWCALFMQTGSSGTMAIVNNIFWNWGKAISDYSNANPSTFTIYNNTFYFCGRSTDNTQGAINIGSSNKVVVYLKNNLIVGTTRNYFFNSIVYGSSQCNISMDATSPNVNYRNLSPIFVNASTALLNTKLENLYLVSTDTSAYQRGVDLSADAGYAFNTDGGGNPWPAGAWSIGALGLQPQTRKQHNVRWVR